MKRRSIWTVLASLIFVICTVFGVACTTKNNSPLTLSKTSLSLNLYDEVALTVDEDVEVLWTSSDESIVKVSEDGLVMAQGVKGDATVTAKSGKRTATCTVKVVKKGISPVLDSPDARSFVNAVTTPEIYVKYKDAQYQPESVRFVSSDETVVLAMDGQIKGVKEGTATLTVFATWKKTTVEGEIGVAVYPEQSLLLVNDEVDLFCVPDETEAKKNRYEVEVELFDKGVAVENPSITLTPIGENADFVTVEGTVVAVDKEMADALTQEGKKVVEVLVTGTVGGNQVSATLTVNVYPNYTVMDLMTELTDTKLAQITPVLYDNAVDGRTGVLEYSIPNVYKNAHASASESQGSWLNNIWSNWNTRLEFFSTMTLNGISAYESIKENGYRLLSFDVYYQGHYNENGELMQSGMFFGTNGCSSYFYVDCQNNREDILIVNQAGEITNTLKLNEWQTVYFDLDALITASTIAGKNDCNSFLSMNQVGDVCYIDDIRYWYDTTVLDGYENKLDMEVRTLTQDSENQAKATAQANEFVAFSPVYASFEESELNGVECYKYDSAKSEGFASFDIKRRNKINAYNDLKGIAIKKGYRYITFDIFVESGDPMLTYYDLFESKELTLSLKDGAQVRSRGVKLFTQENGKKEVEEFTTGEWMSVSVRIDGKAKENFYLTSSKDSVFYIKDVRYYKNDSFIYEYSADAQVRITLDGIESYYYVNDEIDMRSALDVRFAGVKTTDYTFTLNGLGDIASYDETTGLIKALKVGETLVSVNVEKDGHIWNAEFTLRVKKDSRIEVKQENAELYGGQGEYGFDTSLEISVKAYEDKKTIGADRLFYEIISGGEYITLDGNKVTAIKGSVVGAPVVAKVRVWFENTDETETSTEMEIVVFDTYRTRGEDEIIWGNRENYSITYEQVSETVGGRVGVSKYYSETENSWYDRLTIYESAHPIAGNDAPTPYANHVEAFNNLTEKNIGYVSFDVYMTAGALLRVQAPDLTGVKDQRNDYRVGSVPGTENQNIWLFYNGKKVTGSVLADTWYTIVVDHKTAILGNNAWTAIHMTGKGTVYFDNIRYYHDADWMFDFAEEEIVEISGELEEKQFIGESVAFAPTATYMKEEIAGADIGVTSSDTQIASYDKQKGILNFHAVGDVKITVRVSVNGITQERVWNISVFKMLSLDVSKLDMVLGGKETVIATTGSSAYELVWESADKGVATVENGVVTAIGKGTTTITAIFGENEESITVTVADYIQKDGSEIVYTTENPSVGNYGLILDTIGGRTGVYKYSSTAKEWTDKLNIKVGAHLNTADGPARVKALREFKTKGYNYATFDVYMTSGSYMMVNALLSETSSVSDTLMPGSSITEKNENISVYYLGEEVSFISANTWYTVVVDYADIDVDVFAQKAGVYSRIEMGGILGTVYFDNVRYYHDKAWMYDFAEKELVNIRAELAEKQFVGESVAFVPTVEYMNESVADAVVDVTSSDTQIASYDKQTGLLSFHAIGDVQITAKTTINGMLKEKVWNISVINMLSLDVSGLEMVVGGQETITATTGSSNYELVWESADNGVATVVNGVVTAIGKGTTTITAVFGENEESVSVKVADYIQKDGSEIVYTTANPSVGNYGLATETVGGRTGVYKYSSTAKEWTDKLNIKVGGHLNSDLGPARATSLKAFKTKGYNYVTFDIYMTSGSYMMISGLLNETSSLSDTLMPGSSITEKNANIQVYYLDKEVSSVLADTWYTVVVDYSAIDAEVYAQTANVYSRIEMGGILGTVYFDDVRYYGNDSFKTEIASQTYLQCDGSEFVKAKPFSDETGSYGLYDGTVAERTGVYQYTSTNSSWGDKIGVKQANHLSYTNEPVFANSTSAYANMLAKNFAYVTFDICLQSGGIVINAPDANSTADSLQKYDKVYIGSTTKGCDKISYYTVDAQGNYTEAETLSANTWYTVVVEYDTTLTMTNASYAGIDIASLSANTVVYFDNVRYYTANPVK